MSIKVTMQVRREGRHWVGLPEGYPGSCYGKSIAELMEEARAIIPYMLCGDDGIPVRDFEVDCVFTDLPIEIRADIQHYHELAAQRRELDQALNELGLSTVKQLRSVARLTDEDSAAMLGISRQRVNQLRNAS